MPDVPPVIMTTLSFIIGVKVYLISVIANGRGRSIFGAMFFLRLFSRLPLWLLYIVADLLYVLNYHVIGYRKSIIRKNLSIAFPNYTERELSKIVKAFYRNLGDVVMESIKAISIKQEDLDRRVTFIGVEALRKRKEEGRNVVYLANHQCNWEWLVQAGPFKLPHPVYAVYKSLHNKGYDRLMREARGRFGATMIPMEKTVRQIAATREDVVSYALVADQRPFIGTPQKWTNMFGRETAFHPGVEQIPKLAQAIVFFCRMKRLRRGYYEAELIEIASPPYDEDKRSTVILQNYATQLEQMITDNPGDWLWSHDRWKYGKEESSFN